MSLTLGHFAVYSETSLFRVCMPLGIVNDYEATSFWILSFFFESCIGVLIKVGVESHCRRASVLTNRGVRSTVVKHPTNVV